MLFCTELLESFIRTDSKPIQWVHTVQSCPFGYPPSFTLWEFGKGVHFQIKGHFDFGKGLENVLFSAFHKLFNKFLRLLIQNQTMSRIVIFLVLTVTGAVRQQYQSRPQGHKVPTTPTYKSNRNTVPGTLASNTSTTPWYILICTSVSIMNILCSQ